LFNTAQAVTSASELSLLYEEALAHRFIASCTMKEEGFLSRLAACLTCSRADAGDEQRKSRRHSVAVSFFDPSEFVEYYGKVRHIEWIGFAACW